MVTRQKGRSLFWIPTGEKYNMGANSPDLGNLALSKVVEIGIASQLDVVEEIDVDLRTDPGNLIQGKVDSIEITGKGLVVKQDLRMDTIQINTDRVSIDPLRALLGNIELTQPTDAQARIVLTEVDINRALSSDYVRAKFQGLKMEMDGQPVTIDIQEATLDLPGENKFVIAATFLMRESNEVKKFAATAIPEIHEDGNRISLEILAAEGQGLTLKLVTVIFEQLTALLDLRNFNIPGISLKLHKLEAQPGKLVIHAQSLIEKIPTL
jgi:LmeA-like phospholipid-binding